MKNVIEIKNLTKDYQTGGGVLNVLKGINITVEEGDFVAIMGPSGSGKSTLMHIIGALDVPTSGQYILDGRDVSSLSDDELADIRNHNIGFVFQAFNLLSRTSVMDNVCLPAVYAGLPKKEREQRAIEKIDLVGLGDRADHLSNQLSGGQQQRVAIARALIMNPKLILADEPTGNLPTSQTNEVMDYFTELNRAGHTIVVITHEPDVAAFAKRILYLRDGLIVKEERNLAKWRAAAKESDRLEQRLEEGLMEEERGGNGKDEKNEQNGENGSWLEENENDVEKEGGDENENDGKKIELEKSAAKKTAAKKSKTVVKSAKNKSRKKKTK